jgi:hypothetical protein
MHIKLVARDGTVLFDGDTSEFPENVREAALVHGIRQKVGDADSGKTKAEGTALRKAVLESLLAGTWSSKAYGPRKDEDEWIVSEIFKRLKKKNAAADEEVLKKAAQAAFDQPHPIVETLRQEWAQKQEAARMRKAASNVDLSSLLTEL